MKAFGKYLQRRTYSFLNTCWGFTLFCFLLYLLLLPIVDWLTTSNVSPCRLRGNGLFCSEVDFSNNIGNIQSEHVIAHQPIDVVYTWVNGSDPVWKAKKEFWLEKTFGIPPQAAESAHNQSFAAENITESVITSNTTEASNSTIATDSTNELKDEEEDEESETATANRYRDSEELRFSLRSLIRHAPWIRHVYLVTDNQVPYWLNLDTPQLSVVSHDEIFPDKNDLPVFSSPAIEAHLHRIPGLSKKFIYFNDDVFLGAPVLPDDFVSLSGAQKLYMAWEVPKCAPGCSDSWIGDGYCDRACNVSSCNFDYPDCINGSNVQQGSSAYGTGSSNSGPGLFCARQCPDTWIADKICDQRCKNSECGYDAGDCGLDLVLDNYEGVLLEHNVNSMLIDGNDGSDSVDGGMIPNDDYTVTRGGYDTLTGDYHTHHYGGGHYGGGAGGAMVMPQAPALSVPYGNVHAVYFNLSQLPCHAYAKHTNHSSSSSSSSECNLTSIIEQAQWKYTHAEHDDESHWAIQQSILLQKHHLLVVLLYHTGQGQEGSVVPKPLYYPYTVAFTVTGKFGEAAVEEEYAVSFLLELVDEETMIKPEDLLPEGVGKLEVDSLGYQLVDDHRNDSGGGMIRLLPVPLVSHSIAASVDNTSDINQVDIDSLHRSRMELKQQWLLALDSQAIHSISTTTNHSELCISNAVATSSSSSQQFHFAPDITHHQSCYPLQLVSFNSVTAKFNLADDQTEYNKAYPEYVQSPLILLEYDRPAVQRLRQHIRHHTANEQEVEVLVFALPPLPTELQWSQFEYGWIHMQFELSSTGNDKKIVVAAMMKWGHLNDSVTIDNHNFQSFPETDANISNARNNSNATEHHENHDLTTRRRLLTSSSSQSSLPGVLTEAIQNIVSYYLRPVYWLLGNHNSLSLSNDSLTTQKQPKQQHRKLLDTYALSLIHVNRLYTQAFGPDASRKVPAHVPHMIDRDLLQEAQNRWPVEWNATSKHRFRSKDDMQFSFAYYHYTINRHKLAVALPTPTTVLQDLVDSNHDGSLDDNELRTLATLITLGQQPIVAIDDLKQCIALSISTPLSSEYHQEHAHSNNKRSNKKKKSVVTSGKVSKTIKYARHPTIAEALTCPMIMSAVNNTNLLNGLWHHRWQPQPIQESDRESVAFEMIGDNATNTIAQLDSVRARQPKFICINDNMQAPSVELEQALRSFFEALYPMPSQFELSDGKRNPTLYLDEYRRLAKQQKSSMIVQQSFTAGYNMFAELGEVCRRATRQVLKMLLQVTASSTQTSYAGVDDDRDVNQQQEMIAIHKLLRRDAAANPLASRQQGSSSSVNSCAHVIAWLSVFGLLAVIALRRGIVTRTTTNGSRHSISSRSKSSQSSRPLPSPAAADHGDYEAGVPLQSSTTGGLGLTRRWTFDETGRATQQLTSSATANYSNNNDDGYSASQTNLFNSVQLQELELESQAASELARRYANDEMNFLQPRRRNGAESTTEIVAGIIGVETDDYIVGENNGDGAAVDE